MNTQRRHHLLLLIDALEHRRDHVLPAWDLAAVAQDLALDGDALAYWRQILTVRDPDGAETDVLQGSQASLRYQRTATADGLTLALHLPAGQDMRFLWRLVQFLDHLLRHGIAIQRASDISDDMVVTLGTVEVARDPQPPALYLVPVQITVHTRVLKDPVVLLTLARTRKDSPALPFDLPQSDPVFSRVFGEVAAAGIPDARTAQYLVSTLYTYRVARRTFYAGEDLSNLICLMAATETLDPAELGRPVAVGYLRRVLRLLSPGFELVEPSPDELQNLTRCVNAGAYSNVFPLSMKLRDAAGNVFGDFLAIRADSLGPDPATVEAPLTSAAASSDPARLRRFLQAAISRISPAALDAIWANEEDRALFSSLMRQMELSELTLLHLAPRTKACLDDLRRDYVAGLLQTMQSDIGQATQAVLQDALRLSSEFRDQAARLALDLAQAVGEDRRHDIQERIQATNAEVQASLTATQQQVCKLLRDLPAQAVQGLAQDLDAQLAPVRTQVEARLHALGQGLGECLEAQTPAIGKVKQCAQVLDGYAGKLQELPALLQRYEEVRRLCDETLGLASRSLQGLQLELGPAAVKSVGERVLAVVREKAPALAEELRAAYYAPVQEKLGRQSAEMQALDQQMAGAMVRLTAAVRDLEQSCDQLAAADHSVCQEIRSCVDGLVGHCRGVVTGVQEQLLVLRKELSGVGTEALRTHLAEGLKGLLGSLEQVAKAELATAVGALSGDINSLGDQVKNVDERSRAINESVIETRGYLKRVADYCDRMLKDFREKVSGIAALERSFEEAARQLRGATGTRSTGSGAGADSALGEVAPLLAAVRAAVACHTELRRKWAEDVKALEALRAEMNAGLEMVQADIRGAAAALGDLLAGPAAGTGGQAAAEDGGLAQVLLRTVTDSITPRVADAVREKVVPLRAELLEQCRLAVKEALADPALKDNLLKAAVGEAVEHAFHRRESADGSRRFDWLMDEFWRLLEEEHGDTLRLIMEKWTWEAFPREVRDKASWTADFKRGFGWGDPSGGSPPAVFLGSEKTATGKRGLALPDIHPAVDFLAFIFLVGEAVRRGGGAKWGVSPAKAEQLLRALEATVRALDQAFKSSRKASNRFTMQGYEDWHCRRFGVPPAGGETGPCSGPEPGGAGPTPNPRAVG